MARARRNRRNKTAPRQPKRQQIQPVQTGVWKRLVRWWRSLNPVIKVIVFIVTTIVTTIGVVDSLFGIDTYVTSRLSVEPRIAIDPNDIFSTPFDIKNDGFLPVTNVRVDCLYHKMIDQNNSTWIDTKYQGRDFRDIGANRPLAARCRIGQGISPLKEADVSITLSYQSWPFSRTKTETWSYKVLRRSDNTLEWLSVRPRKT